MQGYGAVRSPDHFRAVLQAPKQKRQEIAECLEADECGVVSYFSSSEKENVWAGRDTLSAEVAGGDLRMGPPGTRCPGLSCGGCCAGGTE